MGVPGKYRGVCFSLDGKKETSKISSIALSKILQGRPLLLIPESLATTLSSSKEEALKMIEDGQMLSERVRKEVEKLGEDVECLSLRVLPSVGRFHEHGCSFVFEGEFTHIETALFLIMLEVVREGHELLLDVSSGLNIYGAIAVRVLYNVLTYQKLSNYYAGEASSGEPSHSIAFFPQPKQEGEEVKVELSEVRTRILNQYPLTEQQIQGINRPEEIGLTDTSSKKNLKHVLMTGRRLFNCLVYNTPLPVYYDEIVKFFKPSEIRELEKQVCDSVSSYIQPEISHDRFVKVFRRRFDPRLLRDVLNALALTGSLMKIVEEARKNMTEKGVKLDDLQEFFVKKVYGSLEWFKPNARRLEFEVEQIKKAAESIPAGDFKLLKEVFGVHGSSNMERNFIAHSGFLKDITEIVKLGDGEVYVRYNLAEVGPEVIKRWLS
ncbi:MAG: TM1812 family CRISPR-associated protein [Candidatus Caldarchaeum sp.]